MKGMRHLYSHGQKLMEAAEKGRFVNNETVPSKQ
jgi:hypothetical protein